VTNDREGETVSKPDIRLGNNAGLVRSGSRTARNEGAVPRLAGRPYAKNIFGGHFETVSDAGLTDKIAWCHGCAEGSSVQGRVPLKEGFHSSQL
jgi:hypothetical protein